MQRAPQTGHDLSRWVPPPVPPVQAIEGRSVRLEPLDADTHAADLHRAFNRHDALWDYMPYGPFTSSAAYHRWAKEMTAGTDPMFFVLRDRTTGHCGGIASYLRISPAAGSIEVGHICISPELQRSCAATEAMYLAMKQVFEAGYRRYEWKCDARLVRGLSRLAVATEF